LDSCTVALDIFDRPLHIFGENGNSVESQEQGRRRRLCYILACGQLASKSSTTMVFQGRQSVQRREADPRISLSISSRFFPMTQSYSSTRPIVGVGATHIQPKITRHRPRKLNCNDHSSMPISNRRFWESTMAPPYSLVLPLADLDMENDIQDGELRGMSRHKRDENLKCLRSMLKQRIINAGVLSAPFNTNRPNSKTADAFSTTRILVPINLS
jgi:hypothetical protein